jgi:hypothetical protein
VVAIAVLVSLVSWWYWPRGDARFVGKWETFLAFPDGTHAISVGQKELWGNGTGRMLVGPPQMMRRVSYFAWHVDGGHFVIGNGGQGDNEPVLARVHDWVWRHLGYGVVTSGSRYRITGISRGEIRLEPSAPPDIGVLPDIEILRRVPE